MMIRPCAADRARALARYRRGEAEHVRRRTPHVLEVKFECGCVVEVDFSDPDLTTRLEKHLKRNH